MIPLFKVYMAPDIADFILPVLHSGYIGEGEEVKQFERTFGEYIQNENVVMVNSGTSAITMALKLAGVGYGDSVISSPMTCLATNMAILSVGAVPVWADILPDGTIDPKDVERKLCGKKKKAIICVDWGGLPCHLDRLMDIATSYGIPLIEDACQSIGSSFNGSPIGHDAHYVAYSFQAIKYLTTGDGGALVINTNKDEVKEAKMMRWFGLDRNNGANMRCNQDPPVPGYKWQMNDIMASIGLANIRGLDDRLEIIKRHARFYSSRLGLVEDFNRQSGYFLYTIYVDDVDKFIKYMNNNGVECSKVHDRNDKKSIFKDSEIDLSGVDDFDKYHVCVPVGWWLTEEDIEKIISLVERYGLKT